MPPSTHNRHWVLAALALVTAALAATLGGPIRTPVGAQSGRHWVLTETRSPSYDTGALLEPLGMDGTSDGTLYVADRGHDRVAIIDSAGRVVGSFGAAGDGPLGLNGPTDVAIDEPRDRVYVVDRGNKRLSVFSLAGAPLEHWTSAASGFALVPWAVAVSPASGDVYAISTQPWVRVERFDSAGRWLAGWGDTGGAAGEFRSAQDLTTDSQGRVLVADSGNNRVQVFAADGTFETAIEGLTAVQSVAVNGATGLIYCLHATNRGVPDRVSVFSGGGALWSVVDSDDLPGGFWPGRSVVVSSSGAMALAVGPGAPDGRQGVRRYSAAGALVASTVADPLDHAGFHRPVAIDTGPDGALYAVEGALRATKRYDRDGALTGRFQMAAGQELTIGPDGALYLYDVPETGPVVLRRLEADGTFDWAKPAGTLSGMGLAAIGDRLLATAALSGTVAVFDLDPGEEEPIAEHPVSDPAYASPLDIAPGPGGRLYAAGGDNGRVEVLDAASGRSIGGWTLVRLWGPRG